LPAAPSASGKVGVLLLPNVTAPAPLATNKLVLRRTLAVLESDSTMVKELVWPD
jgi:hypothetical protein